MATEPKFHTISSAAPILGLSPRTLLTWVNQGTIRAYRPTPKGSYLIILAEAEEDIKARTAQAKEDPAELKQRLHAITDRVVAESRARMAAKKKTSVLHGETAH